MTATTPTRPLAQLKVLDMSRMYPGAFCTQLLADLGAEVLKVEAPGFGDGMRAMAAPGAFNAAHHTLNRGKRSMTLDTRKPGAVDILRRLVREYDIVIDSAKPGSLDASGMGFVELRKENPGLIWCSISGFGQSGPNVQQPGHDITYTGYAGVLGRLTVGDPAVSACAISLPTAALMAAVGILSAVTSRAITGVGSFVDANMVDSAMWIIGEDIAKAVGAPGPGWGSAASRGVYRCGDGRYVTVASTEPRTWARMCEGLGLPELLDHQMGGPNEQAAIDKVTTAFLAKPMAAWVGEVGLAGGIGPVNEPGDLVDDGQLTGRGSLINLDDSPVKVLANPIRLDGADGAAASAATAVPPVLGQHTDDALTAAGFSAAEIAAFRAAGTIA